MKIKTLICKKDRRREEVRAKPRLNGLDSLEVSDDQLMLTVYFLGKAPEDLTEANFRIEGGLRTRDVTITKAETIKGDSPELDDIVKLTVSKPGDFSTYTLRLVGVEDIDVRYDHIEFSFKINCASDLDCSPECVCEPPNLSEPGINYLAKDYASFRQLILDRLALLMPDWKERHVPDLGVALVEVLAYAGDYLSYFQDAVATEAYLDTARERISVRRHARLVDYYLHEGCNARAWVTIRTDQDLTGDRSIKFTDIYFTTGLDDKAGEIFEPLVKDPGASLQLYAGHSEIKFYTWGGKECCLPKGATAATLLDGWAKTEKPQPEENSDKAVQVKSSEPQIQKERSRNLHLSPGDVLIFEEVLGPKTGLPSDADPRHRHAVRLTSVEPAIDPLDGTPVIEIKWHNEDALPFPLCLSAVGQAPDCKYLSEVSVARGNVILVDHGRTIDQPEDLGTVRPFRTEAKCLCADHPGDSQTIPARCSPRLARTPLTYSEPVSCKASATGVLKNRDPRNALPHVELTAENTNWMPRHDLLESNGDDEHFVVEIDNEGVAHLRFGDGEMGRQPQAGMSFDAAYRTGNGTRGNVGGEVISRIVLRNTILSGISLTVRNPMPACGGTDAEPIAEAKLFAPHSFRKKIERAITANDYQELAERNPAIQGASARLVWTGSWYEADVAIDPAGAEDAAENLLRGIKKYLRRYRRMGHDLAVELARYVPIDLKMTVCVLPHFQRAHVKTALLDVFSNRALAGGKPGFFHPDNLTFREGIFLSRIIAAAQAVPGVESVTVSEFHRLYELPNREIENGILPLNNNEIAQLDNDPNYPERGRLDIRVGGGR